MTYYNKDEHYIIGLDFDGTITPTPRGGFDFPPPTLDFLEFYSWATNNGNKKDKIALCIHTARDLDNDENYEYISQYLDAYNLKEIYIPKRDAKTIKNRYGDVIELPYRVAINSKLMCACYVDDINIGTPKLRDGQIDWKRVQALIKIELRNISKYWRKRNTIADKVNNMCEDKV